jgi:hypothetical protein
MAETGKVLLAIICGVAGFLAMSFWGPFSKSRFDYASAPMEEKQKYLESKARNMSRGFKLTAGNSSEISNTYVDAKTDLVSLTITLNKSGSIPASELLTARNLLMKTACSLTDRKLLTETGFKLRIRYFQANGANLMMVEANGESCAPYL